MVGLVHVAMLERAARPVVPRSKRACLGEQPNPFGVDLARRRCEPGSLLEHARGDAGVAHRRGGDLDRDPHDLAASLLPGCFGAAG